MTTYTNKVNIAIFKSVIQHISREDCAPLTTFLKAFNLQSFEMSLIMVTNNISNLAILPKYYLQLHQAVTSVESISVIL